MPQPTRKDPTFTNYTADQAREYAQHRSGYPPRLIQHILSHHEKTGGKFGCVLDLGCGPGNSTRDLGSHFDGAIGVDPSNEMTNAARGIGGYTKSGIPVKYVTSDGEACEGIKSNSVDLPTAAMSAHWFDMERFWPTATPETQWNRGVFQYLQDVLSSVYAKGGGSTTYPLGRRHPPLSGP